MDQRVRPADRPDTVRTWDIPTRLFHWSLVTLLAASWASFEYSDRIADPTLKVHRWIGYAVLVLLAWRVLWGMVGTNTSRFAMFVRWPWQALSYGLDLLRGRSRHFLSHNPLGAYMVLALMVAVGGQATLGLFTVEHNDLTAGPLYRLVPEEAWTALSKWHRWVLYWVIVPLIGLHVTANVLYGLFKREPLIRAMFTGRKPSRAYEDAPEAVIAHRSCVHAAICLVAAVVFVFGGMVALGGNVF